MKILFLDIDGVLNTADDPGGVYLNPSLVNNLNSLVQRAGDELKVVLSSSWRLHMSLDEVNTALKAAGATFDLFDRTLDLYSLEGMKIYNERDYPRRKMSDYSFPYRAIEIHAWLVDHQSEITSYVVIDDIYSWGWMRDRVIVTDPRMGLTEKNCEAALEILSSPIKPWEFQPVTHNNYRDPWFDFTNEE